MTGNVEGFGMDFNDLPPEIKEWVEREAEKQGMDIPDSARGHGEHSFKQKCNHVDTTFCGTHGSVWPDIVGMDKCLFMSVMEWAANFAHHPGNESAGGLMAALGAWVATMGEKEE